MRRVGCQRPSLAMYLIPMSISSVRTSVGRVLPTVLALCCFGAASTFVFAQADKPSAASDKPAEKPAVADKSALPPLPADAHVQQTIQLDGKALHYTVTVSSFPVRDGDGKIAGEVVATAYTAEGENRPVTFALNGGPGASSVYLNFGAIGPKHLAVGNEGDSPSDPTNLTDNPGTWLDFTDLVFIDPIGTGFSRSKVPEAEAKKLFYSTVPDIQYLSRVMYDWLVKNDRLGSRKYLVGESYGGFRGPRITHYLQSQLGVALNGVVLVSPYLNPTVEDDGDLSPLAWMMTLPSITAAHLEREKKLTPEAMAETRHKRKGTPGHAEPFLPSAVRGADRVSTGAPRLLLPRSAARARVTSSSNRAYGRSSAVRRATMT